MTVATRPTVFIVDDDHAVRDSLSAVMNSVDLGVETFESAQEFLSGYDTDRPGCLVLDVRMPRLSGLDLMDRLREDGVEIPIIFITGHGDVPTAVRALKSGAVDFLEKPFSHQDLLDRIHEAIRLDSETRRNKGERQAVETRMALLTPRERQVLDLIVAGRPNKIIAETLEISLKTVEHHRSRIMHKMGAQSAVDLVRRVLEARSSGAK